MTTQDVPPIKGTGESGDKMEALRLSHQLLQTLPPMAAKALGDELYWLAERTSLVGRKRYLDLATEVRTIIATRSPEAEEAAA